MRRYMLMVLREESINADRMTRINCPGCGNRLFDALGPVVIGIGLPNMQRMVKIDQTIKCPRCGRIIGIIIITDN